MEACQRAKDYCTEQINWYYKTGKGARRWYNWVSFVTLVLSGLTPIVILVDFSKILPVGPVDLSKLIPAIFAAIVAILTSLMVHFNWRDAWVNFITTAEILKSELLKFETRATDRYNPQLSCDQALANFVSRVDEIISEERATWRAGMLKSLTENNRPRSATPPTDKQSA
jgi:Protein of unknown function (DUF4231)